MSFEAVMVSFFPEGQSGEPTDARRDDAKMHGLLPAAVGPLALGGVHTNSWKRLSTRSVLGDLAGGLAGSSGDSGLPNSLTRLFMRSREA